MNSINPIKHNYKLSTRNYTVSKNNNFKTQSVGLIQSFKIINFEEIKKKYNENDENQKDKNNEKINKIVPSLTIGNFSIIPYILYSSNQDNQDTINIKDLRNYIRNIDYPETDFDNKLINFEHFLFSQQLKSTEHYYTIKNSDLQNTIFTSGVNVYIDLKIINENNEIDESCENIFLNEELQIEETFWDKIYNE
jgi:hypothetical protein